MGRSEAEAMPGALRAPSDTATGGPKRASARGIKPVGALGLTMAEILSVAAQSADLIADPQFTYTRLVDSFNPGGQATMPGGSHCDDTLIDGVPSLGGYPLECPRIEGAQVGNLDGWFPIAAVNRFDPDALTLLLAGPATTGIPSRGPVGQLLAWERQLRAGLSGQTLSGRPVGAH